MPMDFQGLEEQVQLVKIAQAKASLDATKKMRIEATKDVDTDLYMIASSLAYKIVSGEIGDRAEKHQAQYEATVDDAARAELAPLIVLFAEEMRAAGHYSEVIQKSRRSEFETVRERSWADVDERISEIETGRFKGKYLQNILYALSVGPFSSSDRPKDTCIRFQTGHYEHYRLPELLDDHWLITSSPETYGDFGDRRSILTERGKEVLERLTIKYGEPEWAAKFQPEAPAVASENHDNSAHPA